jgi:hypothetical protein
VLSGKGGKKMKVSVFVRKKKVDEEFFAGLFFLLAATRFE